jgi:transcriptional regulator with XRE-family HTH domain
MSAIMSFGTVLKKLREEAGLSQEALAREAGLSTSTVAKLEQTGIDPSWPTVRRLARALGISVAAFDEGDPEEPPPPARGRGRGKKP